MKSLFLMPLSCLFKRFLAIVFPDRKFLFKELKASGFIVCRQLLSLCILVCLFGNILKNFVYLIAISLRHTSSSGMTFCHCKCHQNLP